VSRGRRADPARIGAFVLGALALAGVVLVVWGSGQLFRQTSTMVCYFTGSVNGLDVGAAVKFRGVPIGAVKDIRFRLPPPEVASADIRIPVWIDLDLTRLSELRGTPMKMSRERLDQLIGSGLRAQLQTESFVTGVLYVGLDFFPGSPIVLVRKDDPEVLEIPTMPTLLEQASKTFQSLMARLDKLDLEGLVVSLRSAIEGVDALARSPELEQAIAAVREAFISVRQVSRTLEPSIGPAVKNLDQAVIAARTSLRQLDATLTELQGLVGAQAPLAVGLTRTLADLGEAARSVRDLADYLDRNPDALLLGRPGS
jgi:paraquat-inducible protein B